MRRGTVLVTGATGVQGSLVVRELVRHGWRVRAMTRDPSSARARALAGPRVTVVPGNVRDPASLGAAVSGVDGVFLLEPWRVDGADGARTAGVAIANAAAGAGVSHVVFSSMSGAGSDPAVPHLQRKRAVELHLRALGIPTTVIRPAMLMERAVGHHGQVAMLDLLEQALRVPVAATRTGAPTRAGVGLLERPDTDPVADVAVQVVAGADVAMVARLAFEEPARHVGLSIDLAGDAVTVPEMRATYRAVTGREPPGAGAQWAPGGAGPTAAGSNPAGPNPGGSTAGAEGTADLRAVLDWLAVEGFEADLPSLRVKYSWLTTFAAWLLGAGPR